MRQWSIWASIVGAVLIAVTPADVRGAQPDPSSTRAPVRHAAHVGDHAAWCMRRYARHEFRLAIEDCDTALIAYPEDAEIYSNRGSAHFMLNEAILAISDFSAAIRLKPDNPNLHYNRATAYAALGEHAKAIDGFTDTIRFGPKFFPAYFNRGIVFERLGHPDNAIADYRKVLELAPSFAPALRNLRRLGAE
jgi:tetratricopeptide (TPR) repeat protein